ncbi:IPT/TIG domain-containing protein [Pedobacter ginsengisoli]|uniref:IPT/TIG domain-containing protein n=1 Tax=Pedobacter ginsengisoli TaxID=363852 RepID=UPI002551A7EA|nr:IPT/TIG domain-containing protein [Pedobacter ginsengisoli]
MFNNIFSSNGCTYRLGYRVFSMIAITLLLFSGCSKDRGKEPEPEKEIPPAGIETTSLTFLTPVLVELKGNIINDENQKISDHGFVYVFGTEADLSNSLKVPIADAITSGSFSMILKDFQFPMVNGVKAKLFVKAYVTDKNGTHFGKAISLNDGGLTGVVSPLGGKTGDVITITGNYKGLKSADIEVTFEDVAGQIKTISDNALTVSVPVGIPAGHGDQIVVKLQVGNVAVDATTKFFMAANIKDIIPKSGPIGSKVNLVGDNLPLYGSQLYVFFGNASMVSWGPINDCYVYVPAAIPSEKVKLYYNIIDVPVALPFEFTVTPPVIKSITPNPAFYNEPVTMHIDNMNPRDVGDAPVLKLGDFSQSFRPNANGDFVIDAPYVFKPGQVYTISVTYGPHTVTAPMPLTIKP